MRNLLLVLSAVAALSACASRNTAPPAPACRGDVFPLNATEPAA